MSELFEKTELKIAICDDEQSMLVELQDLTEQTLSKDWALEIRNYGSAKELLAEKEDFQIVILDIQLADGNGVELAKKIITHNPNCCIIFVSGFLCYVSDVYEVPHLCLVLKDQLQTQLPRFLLRAAKDVKTQTECTITANVKGEALRFNISEICFLERRGHITYINLVHGQQFQTRDKLGDLLKATSGIHLCRCHVSFVVNLRHVEAMKERDFIMRNGEIIPISRVNMQSAKSAFFRYLRENT